MGPTATTSSLATFLYALQQLDQTSTSSSMATQQLWRSTSTAKVMSSAWARRSLTPSSRVCCPHQQCSRTLTTCTRQCSTDTTRTFVCSMAQRSLYAGTVDCFIWITCFQLRTQHSKHARLQSRNTSTSCSPTFRKLAHQHNSSNQELCSSRHSAHKRATFLPRFQKTGRATIFLRRRAHSTFT